MIKIPLPKRVILLFLSFAALQFSNQAIAQDFMRQNIEQRLAEANALFQRNEFEAGASRIREACYTLKSSPQSMPEANPSAIAAMNVEFLNGKLSNAISTNDYSTSKKIVTAEQTLLTALIGWEPQNPKWHYQKALLLESSSQMPATGLEATMASHLGIQANLPGQLDMHPLQNAIQECDRAISMSSDQSYRELAMQLKQKCESEIQRRTTNINAINADYYRKLPKGIPPPGMYNNTPSRPIQSYCPKCGMTHGPGPCPYTHGG